MPVVIEACFDEEVLAREAQVVGGGAGDRVDVAERVVDRIPHHSFARVRHFQRPLEMISVHEV